MWAFLGKLRHGYIWQRILRERLSEPLLLNLAALGAALFGSFRTRVAYDLIPRAHNAYALLKAAELAARYHIPAITAVEFGVAAGAGLCNLAHLATQVSAVTGVRICVVGFDTGVGMPQPSDYRDHPELYMAGDFPMDAARLRAQLPENAELILGPLEETVPAFASRLSAAAPLGYAVLDVDYYSSSRDALELLRGPAENYLPVTWLYLDDLAEDSHNSWCGEQLAVREFCDAHAHRKIEHSPLLRGSRLFQRARWIDHMFALHVLDHPIRNTRQLRGWVVKLENPYLARLP